MQHQAMKLAVLLLAGCLLLSTSNGLPIQTAPKGFLHRGQSQQTGQLPNGFSELFNEVNAENTSGSLIRKTYLLTHL